MALKITPLPLIKCLRDFTFEQLETRIKNFILEVGDTKQVIQIISISHTHSSEYATIENYARKGYWTAIITYTIN